MVIKHGNSLNTKFKADLKVTCRAKKCKLRKYFVVLNKPESKDNFNSPVYYKIILFIISVLYSSSNYSFLKLYRA